jgi:hypothetical protein
VSIFNGDGGQVIGNFDSGRWVAFNNINLNGGLLGLRVRGSNSTNGTLRLRAGSATGAILCTLNWTTASGFVTRETSCTPSLTGVQTLVLVNESVQWINLNWIEINRQSSATPTPPICAPAAQAMMAQSKGSAQSAQATEVCQAFTATPIPPPLPNQRGLRESYFNNPDLQGTPVINNYSPTATTPFLFNFGAGGPTQFGTSTDNFSIRYEGVIWIPSNGSYTFYISSDDGVRLTIGGTVVTNDWNRAASGAIPILPGNAIGSIALNSAFYPIVIEYREFSLSASIEIQWEQTLGASPFSRGPLTFENLYLPNSAISTPTPLPTTPPPPPYRINIISDGSRAWSSFELSSINSGVEQVGIAFDYLANSVTSRQAAFNLGMIENSGTEILFIRTMSASSQITITNYQYQFGSRAGQIANLTYPNANSGNCLTSQEGIVNNILRPAAVICNSSLIDNYFGTTPTLEASPYTIVHELGHLFDYRTGNGLSSPIGSGTFLLRDCNTDIVMGPLGNWTRGSRGWGTGPAQYLNGLGNPAPLITDFQQNSNNIPIEAAADSFLNWVYRLNATSGAVAQDFCAASPRPAYNHWNGPGFQNLEWNTQPNPSFVANSAGIPGAADNRLPGDVRHRDMDQRMRAIFASRGW